MTTRSNDRVYIYFYSFLFFDKKYCFFKRLISVISLYLLFPAIKFDCTREWVYLTKKKLFYILNINIKLKFIKRKEKKNAPKSKWREALLYGAQTNSSLCFFSLILFVLFLGFHSILSQKMKEKKRRRNLINP